LRALTDTKEIFINDERPMIRLIFFIEIKYNIKKGNNGEIIE